jgi:hypothetical protein
LIDSAASLRVISASIPAYIGYEMCSAGTEDCRAVRLHAHFAVSNLFSLRFLSCRLDEAKMKFLLKALCSVSLLIVCGHAQAQFSQPPPDRPPPTCTIVNGAKSDDMKPNAAGSPSCASDNFRAFLRCKPPARSSSVVSCVATTEWFNGQSWVAVSPTTPVYDWGFIIDAQEYYLSSGEDGVPGIIAWSMADRYDSVYFDCGRNGDGHVRVTAMGKTAQVPYYCSPWGAYD